MTRRPREARGTVTRLLRAGTTVLLGALGVWLATLVLAGPAQADDGPAPDAGDGLLGQVTSAAPGVITEVGATARAVVPAPAPAPRPSTPQAPPRSAPPADVAAPEPDAAPTPRAAEGVATVAETATATATGAVHDTAETVDRVVRDTVGTTRAVTGSLPGGSVVEATAGPLLDALPQRVVGDLVDAVPPLPAADDLIDAGPPAAGVLGPVAGEGDRATEPVARQTPDHVSSAAAGTNPRATDADASSSAPHQAPTPRDTQDVGPPAPLAPAGPPVSGSTVVPQPPIGVAAYLPDPDRFVDALAGPTTPTTHTRPGPEPSADPGCTPD